MMEQLKLLEERLHNILALVNKLKKENQTLSSKNLAMQTRLKESEEVLNGVLEENARLKEENEKLGAGFKDKDVMRSKIEEMILELDKIEANGKE